MADQAHDFDYIIVGGSTTGIPIASRLCSYIPSSRILLSDADSNAMSHPKVTDPSKIPTLSKKACSSITGNGGIARKFDGLQSHCRTGVAGLMGPFYEGVRYKRSYAGCPNVP
jgi:hypothetical protein